MIRNWDEIEERYNLIKDHKPKASKKLKDLGEILASAYELDPKRADEMWQYIIDLNINDDINNAKFYIAQIYKKLLEMLSPQKAVDFVSMRPDRVRLMFTYGYEGDMVINIAYTVIGSHIQKEEFDHAIEILSLLEDKFDDGFFFYIVLNAICELLEQKPNQTLYRFRYDIPVEIVHSFYDVYNERTDNDYIYSILYSRLCLMSCAPDRDENDVLLVLKNLSEVFIHSHNDDYNLFTSFLYHEREIIGNKAESLLFDYMNEKQQSWLPILYYANGEPIGNDSAWLARIIQESPRLLRLVFQEWFCSDFPKNQLRKYIHVSDWKSFLQYLILGLNQSNRRNSDTYLTFIKDEINEYLDNKSKGIYYENGKWWRKERYGGSQITEPRITKENISGFIEALAKACLLTSGSNINEDLIITVRTFVTKETNSTNVLRKLGLDIEPDNRTAIKSFLDYINNNSHKKTDGISVSEQSQAASRFIKDIKRETNKTGIELGRELARHPQIVEYLFLQTNTSFIVKEDIIFSALLDDNYAIATKCIDYMIETTHYHTISKSNAWLTELHNVLCSLLRDLLSHNKTEYGKPYSYSVTSSIIQIAKKCLPYLWDDDALLIEILLLEIQPDSCDLDAIIRQVMLGVEDYTVRTKPRGYSSRINDITRNIQQAMELFFQLNQVDVIALILRKISDGRDNIAGPTYEAWMTIFHKATNEQLKALYEQLSDIYTTYISVSNQHMALSLLKLYGGTGNIELFNRLKEQVIQKHGYIEGIGNCLKHNESTVTLLHLFNNPFIEASFLYWNVYSYAYDPTDVHGLTIALRINNKKNEFLTIFLSNIKINNYSYAKMATSSEKNIWFTYINDKKAITEDLLLSWERLPDVAIKEIQQVSFCIIVKKDESIVAKSDEITIIYDPIHGVFQNQEKH